MCPKRREEHDYIIFVSEISIPMEVRLVRKHEVPFKEHNIMTSPLTTEELRNILRSN